MAASFCHCEDWSLVMPSGFKIEVVSADFDFLSPPFLTVLDSSCPALRSARNLISQERQPLKKIRSSPEKIRPLDQATRSKKS
jgi:hypothetical protein